MSNDNRTERNTDCPCKHLVELQGKLDVESQITKMALEHTQERTAAAMKEIVADFSEAHLQIKECLLSLKESTNTLRDGSNKFKEHDNAFIRLNKKVNLLTITVTGVVIISVLNGNSSAIFKTIVDLSRVLSSIR